MTTQDFSAQQQDFRAATADFFVNETKFSLTSFIGNVSLCCGWTSAATAQPVGERRCPKALGKRQSHKNKVKKLKVLEEFVDDR